MAMMPLMHVMAILALMTTIAIIPISIVMAATSIRFSIVGWYGYSCSYE